MDYINILKEIVPKMKMQMHSNKGIASLDKIHKVIESFDKEKLNQCPRAKFENYFLSLLGIFLKTQLLKKWSHLINSYCYLQEKTMKN